MTNYTAGDPARLLERLTRAMGNLKWDAQAWQRENPKDTESGKAVEASQAARGVWVDDKLKQIADGLANGTLDREHAHYQIGKVARGYADSSFADLNTRRTLKRIANECGPVPDEPTQETDP